MSVKSETITIGTLTLDALNVAAVRALAGSGQLRTPPWPDGISREQFQEAFKLGRGKAYKTLRTLVESGDWECWQGVVPDANGTPKYRVLYHPKVATRRQPRVTRSGV